MNLTADRKWGERNEGNAGDKRCYGEGKQEHDTCQDISYFFIHLQAQLTAREAHLVNTNQEL